MYIMAGKIVGPGAARSGAKGVMGGVKRKGYIKPGIKSPQKKQTKPVIIKRPGM